MGELTIAKTGTGLRFTTSGALVRQTVNERFDATMRPGQPRLFRQRNRTTLASTESRLSQPMRDRLRLGDRHELSSQHRPAQPNAGPGRRDATAHRRRQHGRGRDAVRRSLGRANARPDADRRGPRDAFAADRPRASIPADSSTPPPSRDTGSRSETKFLPSFAASIAAGPRHHPVHPLSAGFPARRAGHRQQHGPALSQRPGGDDGGRAALGGAGRRSVRPRRRRSRIPTGATSRPISSTTEGLPVTTNIGDGRIWSFDARAVWRPVPELRLEGAFVVNDSRLTGRRDRAALLPRCSPPVAQVGAAASQRRRTRLAGSGSTIIMSSPTGLISRPAAGPAMSASPASASARCSGGTEGNYVDTRLVRADRPRQGGRHARHHQICSTRRATASRSAPRSTSVRSGEITPLQPRTIRMGFDTHF